MCRIFCIPGLSLPNVYFFLKGDREVRPTPSEIIRGLHFSRTYFELAPSAQFHVG